MINSGDPLQDVVVELMAQDKAIFKKRVGDALYFDIPKESKLFHDEFMLWKMGVFVNSFGFRLMVKKEK